MTGTPVHLRIGTDPEHCIGTLDHASGASVYEATADLLQAAAGLLHERAALAGLGLTTMNVGTDHAE
ncbi:hypothetical protein [Kitasatospora sp. MBT63]|uniref:hypothetical protein n=1 Tax=Kitasatospora sp. MBT63 TaxID=1444768 RepID=UPI00053AA04D|nr:hypothetical protein [Kitasatospora sp. MBT63]